MLLYHTGISRIGNTPVIDFIAIITIIVWPVVPLFWIPVHGFSRVFKRLGLFTYIMPLLTWLPLAYLIYQNRLFLLQFKINLPLPVQILGVILLVIGTLLHIWTGKLLGLWGLIGLPEVSRKVKKKARDRRAFFSREASNLSGSFNYVLRDLSHDRGDGSRDSYIYRFHPSECHYYPS